MPQETTAITVISYRETLSPGDQEGYDRAMEYVGLVQESNRSLSAIWLKLGYDDKDVRIEAIPPDKIDLIVGKA